MVEIIPAILATSEDGYAEDIKKITGSAFLEDGWVHIDFADNVFVPNKTITPEIVAKYPGNLKKEAHLMVQNPLEWVSELLDEGFKRIIIHIESEGVEEAIQLGKSKGFEVGLAVNLDTPLERLYPFFSTIDLVLVMSIEPGFQGQPFKEESLARIRKVRGVREEHGFRYKIGIDGHVNDGNAKALIDAGADNLVIGSFLVKGDIDENIEKIWEKTNDFA